MSPKQNRTIALAARWLRSRGFFAFSLFTVVACGAGPRPAPAPPCDQSCQDGVALLGLRNAIKLAYNFEVSTKPVGAQDGTAPCVSFDGTTGRNGACLRHGERQRTTRGVDRGPQLRLQELSLLGAARSDRRPELQPDDERPSHREWHDFRATNRDHRARDPNRAG